MRVESGKMELGILEEVLNAKRITNVRLYNWENGCFMDDVADKTKECANYEKFKLVEHYNANKTKEFIVVCF